MDELIEKIKKYDWGQSRAALVDFTDSLREVYGQEKKLKKFEDNLLDVLNSSDATPAGKQFACRQLSVIGTKRSVSTLAKMLTVEETSDMARYALERIADASVDNTLREALTKTTGKIQVGIINSLGQRRDSKSVSALGKLVSDSDSVVAEAAVAALGMIADSEATKVLAQAKGQTSGKLRVPVLDAYLKCADRLAAQGQKESALAMYKELYKPEEPTPIRTAALRGIVTVTKEDKK
jgi:HEAT repeat protein